MGMQSDASPKKKEKLGMDDKLPDEFHVLDKAVWKQIKQLQGSGKGNDPVVMSSGYVYAGKNNVGKEVRLFVKEDKE